MTGAKNMDGCGISDAIPQTDGLPTKPKYKAPPMYNVQGPDLATDWEKANRPVMITEWPVVNFVSKVDGILAERGKQYGSFDTHARVSQGLLRVIRTELDLRNKTLNDDMQEALNIICNKIGRIINGNPDYIDNWDDIAGYATLVSKRLSNDGRK